MMTSAVAVRNAAGLPDQCAITHDARENRSDSLLLVLGALAASLERAAAARDATILGLLRGRAMSLFFLVGRLSWINAGGTQTVPRPRRAGTFISGDRFPHERGR